MLEHYLKNKQNKTNAQVSATIITQSLGQWSSGSVVPQVILILREDCKPCVQVLLGGLLLDQPLVSVPHSF